MRLSRPIVLSVVLTAIVCTSVSVAIAGSSGNAIHGCVAKKGGALRVANKCRHSERSISWSKTGPAGPQGPQGPQGAAGKNGTNGTDGKDGINGLNGTARAYAYVNGSVTAPSFVAAATKGFTTVSEPSLGEYCLTAPGLDPAATAAVVGSVRNSAFAGIPTYAELDPDVAPCVAGQFHVVVEQVKPVITGGVVTGVTEAPTPNVSFTILVP